MARYTSGLDTYTCPTCDLEFETRLLINPDPDSPITVESLSHARAECPKCHNIMRIIDGVAFRVMIDMHMAYG